MNPAATSAGAAPTHDDLAGQRSTLELLAETASRVSAHTSALNSVALRLLALDGRVANLAAKALRGPQPADTAKWRGSLPGESSSKTLAAVPKIRLLAVHGVDGNTSLLELALLASLVKIAGARAVFEFGTFDGRTAVNLAANCALGGTVFTLDLPSEQANVTRLPLDDRDKVYIDKPAPGARYKGTPFETSIVQLHGDSAAFDFSRFHNATDFVFIDASHKYEYVLNDTRIALRLLRDGRGTIAWHDYTQWWDGVVRALEELHATEPKLAGMRHIEGTDLVYTRVE